MGYDYSFELLYIQLLRERLSNKSIKAYATNRKALWVVLDHCVIVKFTRFQRDGKQNYEYLSACLKRNKQE